jgi:hypothetical protein
VTLLDATPEEAPAAPSAPPTLARVSAGGRGAGLLSSVERITGITPIGLAVVGSALMMLVLSRLLVSRGMAMLAYGLFVVLGLSWVLGRRKLAIDAERSELPSRVAAKRTIDAELRLTARRRVSGIIVEEDLDEQLGQPVRVAVPVLPAGESVAHAYQFVPQYLSGSPNGARRSAARAASSCTPASSR